MLHTVATWRLFWLPHGLEIMLKCVLKMRFCSLSGLDKPFPQRERGPHVVLVVQKEAAVRHSDAFRYDLVVAVRYN